MLWLSLRSEIRRQSISVDIDVLGKYSCSDELRNFSSCGSATLSPVIGAARFGSMSFLAYVAPGGESCG